MKPFLHIHQKYLQLQRRTNLNCKFSQRFNEATWLWCEPTCLCLEPLFDLGQCDLLLVHNAAWRSTNYLCWFWTPQVGQWCTPQVGGAHCRSVVHNVVTKSGARCRSHKPRHADRQTESKAYEPTVQLHKWAQNLYRKCSTQHHKCKAEIGHYFHHILWDFNSLLPSYHYLAFWFSYMNSIWFESIRNQGQGTTCTHLRTKTRLS